MLLNVENVSLAFGKRMILDNVSMKIKPGTIIAITGKSGSGKTSLLGIISGLLNPDTGRVMYQGKNIVKWGDFRKSHFRNREIGFVFQFFNLLPDFTSYQNIAYPALLKFFPGPIAREIRELAEYLNISNILNQYPETLSGGERQRVAIARAIINHPKIILADEPTGNLDDSTAKDIRNLFVRLKEDDKMAVIIVTHDHSLVQAADEHYHLEEGVLTRLKGGSAGSRKKVSAKGPARTAKKRGGH